MKIGKVLLTRRLIFSFSIAFLIVSAWIGYSVINTDLGSSANVTVKGKGVKGECNQANFYDRIACLATVDSKQSDFVSNQFGVDFGSISSGTNGKGVYTFASTIDNQYPVHYYRGNIDDNYVLLGGYCWKAVRTTETGGVKLIYNGVQHYETESEIIDRSSYDETNDATYPYTFDDDTKQWTSTMKTANQSGTITFHVDEDGEYVLNYTTSCSSSSANAYFYKDNVQIGSYNGSTSGTINLGNITTATELKVVYTKTSGGYSGNDTVSFSMTRMGENQVFTCSNSGASALIDTKRFVSNPYYSPAYVGYMYGEEYKCGDMNDTTGKIYGRSFTYSDGKYHLVDTTDTIDGAYHYTCLDNTTECEEVKYLFSSGWNYAGPDYMTLKDGKDIQDILTEAYQNDKDSLAKQTIDTWFLNTFSPNFISQGKTYNDYLEDTVWCNDRSMNSLGWDDYVKNGWLPENRFYNNGNPIHLYHGAYGRVEYGGTPIVTCLNKNDAFTVNDAINGNAELTYPIGLLTADEVMLAGGQKSSNISFYLNANTNWWLMSPYQFDTVSRLYRVNETGTLSNNNVVLAEFGIRPSVSLKHSINITSGTGKATDPYVVE